MTPITAPPEYTLAPQSLTSSRLSTAIIGKHQLQLAKSQASALAFSGREADRPLPAKTSNASECHRADFGTAEFEKSLSFQIISVGNTATRRNLGWFGILSENGFKNTVK
jgi:hypothetical protein